MNLLKNKLLLKTGTSVLLISSFSAVNMPVLSHADTGEEIQQQKEKVDQNIKKLKEHMKKTSKKIKKMKKEYKETEKDIEDIRKEIQETKKKIEERSELLGNRLTAIQKQDNDLNLYLEAILGSESISDMIDRVYAVSTIIEADNNLIKEQKNDQIDLEEKQENLKKKKSDLEKQFQKMQEEYEKLEAEKLEQEMISSELGKKLDEAKRNTQLEELNRLKSLQEQSFESPNKDKIKFTPTSTTSKKAKEIIQEASKYLGWKYQWGGSNPNTSFDCSGLTQWSFGKAGIKLPRTAARQYLFTKRITAKELKPGDLIFFSYGSGVAHVGIYVGNGKMLNAQNRGIIVEEVDDYWKQYIAGFGRVPGVN